MVKSKSSHEILRTIQFNRTRCLTIQPSVYCDKSLSYTKLFNDAWRLSFSLFFSLTVLCVLRNIFFSFSREPSRIITLLTVGATGFRKRQRFLPASVENSSRQVGNLVASLRKHQVTKLVYCGLDKALPHVVSGLRSTFCSFLSFSSSDYLKFNGTRAPKRKRR